MKYFVIFLVLIFTVIVTTNPISAQCAYDSSQPHKPCDDSSGTLIIEPHQAQIEHIDKQLFYVIGPFVLESESSNTIRLDSVIFTPPFFPNPPMPGGPVSVKITFNDGIKESISKVGAPFPFIEFTEHRNPQAGVRRNADGTFNFLLSVEKQFISPLKQFKSGIPIDEIECRDGFVVAIKNSNGNPACVKLETKTRLMERGWAEPLGDIIKQRTVQPEPVETNFDFSKIVDANNQFAIDFYSQVTADKEENVFFSPWSISTAFAIAYEGARGNTAEEIQDVFGFIENDKNRRTGFQNIQQKLNEKNSEYKLNVVNALWIKQGYQIKQEYIDVAKTYYDSEVDNVNFVTDEGVNIINEWVKSKTNNKIDELLAKGSTDELTRLVITNAIYFKGEWMYPFSPDWTRQSDFHINKDKTVKVSMMDLDDRKLNYAQNELLEILELPYKREKVSMLILLPKEIEGLKSLEENLTGEKLSQWQESLSETQIAVLLPKFTAETKYDLKDNLQNMGMKIPFDKFNADFSGINETARLYIDQAVHKAFVEVNELGTEAAAATGIEMRLTSGPPATFRADHPFVFLIQDNETGQILFIGKVVDPTA